MAEQLGIHTPTLDDILRWAQNVRGERIIDEHDHLIMDSPDLNEYLKTGIPTMYGFKTVDECID
jgi:hypothetical protein